MRAPIASAHVRRRRRATTRHLFSRLPFAACCPIEAARYSPNAAARAKWPLAVPAPRRHCSPLVLPPAVSNSPDHRAQSSPMLPTHIRPNGRSYLCRRCNLSGNRFCAVNLPCPRLLLQQQAFQRHFPALPRLVRTALTPHPLPTLNPFLNHGCPIPNVPP